MPPLISQLLFTTGCILTGYIYIYIYIYIYMYIYIYIFTCKCKNVKETELDAWKFTAIEKTNFFYFLNIPTPKEEIRSTICLKTTTTFSFFRKFQQFVYLQWRWGSGGTVNFTVGPWESPSGGSASKAPQKC